MSSKLLITDNPNITRLLHERADIYVIDTDSIRLSKPEEINSDWGVWDINKLPIIPSKFTYEFDVENYKTLKQRLSETKGEEDVEIVNCCSPNKYGEYLFWTVMNRLVPNAKEKFKFTRYWLTDLSEMGIRLSKAKSISYDENNIYLKNIYDSCYLENIMRWLVGVNFSRLCSKKFDVKINVGKEKTPLLKVLYEREKTFSKERVFAVKNTFYSNGYLFDAYLSNSNGTKRVFNSKDIIKKELGVQTGNFSVYELKPKLKVIKVPLAFDLYSLQMDCLDLGLDPTQTEEISMRLYEMGLITYPITENAYLSKESVVGISPYSFNLFEDLKLYSNLVTSEKINKIVENSNYVKKFYYPNNTGICLINSDNSSITLSDEEFKVYHLIAKRTLALFLEDSTVETQRFIIVDGKNQFILSSKRILEQNGFLRLYDDDTIFNKSNFDLKSSKIELVKQNRFTLKNFIAMCKNAKSYDNSLDEKLASPHDIMFILNGFIDNQFIAIKNNEIYANVEAIEPIFNNIGMFQISSMETLAMCNNWFTSLEHNKFNNISCWKNIQLYVNKTIKEIKDYKDPTHTYCPKCGGKIVEYPNSYRCENNCISFSKVIKDAVITYEDVKTLVNNGSVRKTVLCKRNGSNSKGYTNARLYLDGLDLRFDFVNV